MPGLHGRNHANIYFTLNVFLTKLSRTLTTTKIKVPFTNNRPNLFISLCRPWYTSITRQILLVLAQYHQNDSPFVIRAVFHFGANILGMRVAIYFSIVLKPLAAMANEDLTQFEGLLAQLMSHENNIRQQAEVRTSNFFQIYLVLSFNCSDFEHLIGRNTPACCVDIALISNSG